MCDVKEKELVDAGFGGMIRVSACLVGLVKALIKYGISVMSADCGHEKAPSRIYLRDGRMMILAPKALAEKILKEFPKKGQNKMSTLKVVLIVITTVIGLIVLGSWFIKWMGSL